MCQPSRYSPKRVDKRRCATENAGHKGVDLVMVPQQLEKGTDGPTLIGEENKSHLYKGVKTSM